MKKKILLIFALLTSVYMGFSQDGTLDTTFNAAGFIKRAGFYGGNVVCAVQNDSNIVFAGKNDQNQMVVMRYLPNGTPDLSFNGTGVVYATSSPSGFYLDAKSVNIQTDGKILIVGNYLDGSFNNRIMLLRFNSDGSADNTFGTAGVVNIAIGAQEDIPSGACIQADGKIVIGAYSLESSGGSYKYSVIRLSSTGAFDTGFNGSGINTVDLGSSNFFDYNMMASCGIALQNDNKIIFVGSYGTSEATRDWVIMRFKTDGVIDSTFNTVGYVTKDFYGAEDFATSVAIDKYDKIVVAGKAGYSMIAARYNADGSLDNSFGSNGVSNFYIGSSYCKALAINITQDERIIIGGMAYYATYASATLRLLKDGSLDNSFGTNGYINTSYLGNDETAGYGQALQPDGKIIVSTGIMTPQQFAFARYNQKRIIFVNHAAMGDDTGTSWENAYSSLQTAIAAAKGNSEIWVAKGVYKPTETTDRNQSFKLINGVSIYGGFVGNETSVSQRNNFGNNEPNETILSGDIGNIGDNSDNSYHIFYHPNVLMLDSTAVLDGFTIRGGNANNVTPDGEGGGMYNDGCSPTLINISFIDNYALYGGAMFNLNSNSPKIINTLFTSNTASLNGGALYVYNCSQLTLINSTITNNNANNGGGIYYNSVAPDTIVMNNCILWENIATNSGKDLHLINNSAVTLNYSCYSSAPNAIYADVNSSYSTLNNCITENPRFVDAASNNFRLFAHSACVDAGNNIYNTTTFDVRGRSRIQDASIDMGAYEWTNGIDPTCTPYYNNINIQLCSGQNYFCGGAFQTTSGIYTDSLQTIIGCDSLIITDLTITSVEAGFSEFVISNTVSFNVNNLEDVMFWDFGDGNFSNENNTIVVHNYANPGFYNVCLTAGDITSTCMNQSCHVIEIVGASINCLAQFTYIDLGGEQIQFDATTSQGAALALYNWEFGTGAVSNLLNPSYTFPTSGYYRVKLTVSDTINDCINTFEQHITVGSPYNDCISDYLYTSELTSNTLEVQSISTGQNIDSYVWNWGDGSFSYTPEATHIYSDAAYHNVCLTIGSSYTGCSQTNCKMIKVGNDPQSCNGTFTYVIDSTISKANSYPVSYKGAAFGDPAKNTWNVSWDFGDNTPIVSGDMNPSHTYQDTGMFLVHFNISNSTCSDDYFDLINLMPNTSGLHAAFGFVIIPNGTKANSYPVSYKGAAFGDPARYSWNFGDGTTDSTTNSPIHIYADDTTYWVCLNIWDPVTGDADQFCDSVSIVDSLYSYTSKEFIPTAYLSIYPNPAKQAVSVKYQFYNDANASIQITDVSGKSIKTIITGKQKAGIYEINVDLSEIKNGTYILQLISDKANLSRKLIIAK